MDGAIEKSAMRKVYMRLLPFAILSYFLAYIDRINVSFAGLTLPERTLKCAMEMRLASEITHAYPFAAVSTIWGPGIYEHNYS